MSDSHVIDGFGGTITVAPAVLSSIVVQAAEGVEGARVRRPRRGLDVAIEDGRARVALELAVRYGAVIPDVAGDVQSRVADALRRSCELDAATVEVAVEELDD